MIGRLNTGQKISGIGHLGLIGWALFGGWFSSEPFDFEVTEVTAISAEEYAALTAQPDEAPSPTTDIITPEAPPVEDATPDAAAPEAPPPDTAQPEASEAPPPDAVPDTIPEPVPTPEPPAETPPALEPPAEDTAVLLPTPSVRPRPRPAPRVAPEPVAQPEPDVQIDDVVQEETAPSEEAEVQVPETEATSPEEATTETVTEADEVANAAPTRSARPKTRPARRADPAPEPAQDNSTQPAQSAETSEPDSSAVNDALAEALGNGGADTTPEPTGPPLTSGEKDALRVAVEQCWNVGSLSTEALNTTVTVGVDMNENGTPNAGSIRMIDSSGGSAASAKQAYEAARRAIIRCGARGFPLPSDKYGQWRQIEMTFNPEKMRIR